MALLETHDNNNKITLNTKGEWIEEEFIYGTWQKLSLVGGIVLLSYGRMKKHTKHKVEQFEYVGMTKDAADSCAEEMIDKYTKDTLISIWDINNGIWKYEDGGEQIMADVKCSWVAGNMWKVTVNVNEVYECTTMDNGSPRWPNDD